MRLSSGTFAILEMINASSIDGSVLPFTTLETQLRLKVLKLMKMWSLNQAQLAAKLGKDQPWLSRRLSEKGHKTRFQLGDIDALCAVFRLSPSELLRQGYGQWDRRSGHERRS